MTKNNIKNIVIAEIYCKTPKEAKKMERAVMNLFSKKTDCIITDRVSLKKLQK